MDITRRSFVAGSIAFATTAVAGGSLLTRYLADPLWQQPFDYDAGHILMPSLHDSSTSSLFYEHFERFTRLDIESLATCHPDRELSRLHYLYLAAVFCRLSQDAGRQIPNGLAAKLASELEPYWAAKPMTWYSDSGYRGSAGMRDLLAWKTRRIDTKLSYYQAINDHDLFAVCALAELRSPHSGEAVRMLTETLRQRSTFTSDGGWLFQPGAWSDHPDYAFVGNAELGDNLNPAPVRDIAEDSSHAHRWPLFLRSLAKQAAPDDKTFLLASLAALRQQFLNHVYVPPTADFPGPRIRNFMDGRNGVYRYNYATVGTNSRKGYGPFELSGILPEGWWGFLPGVSNVWRDFANCFPLADNVIDLYTGPNTTASRHRLVKWPNFFRDGFAEMNVRLVSQLS